MWGTPCTLAALLLLLSAACAAGDDWSERVVRTRQGAVRGVAQRASAGRPYVAFYNLPYAKPPIGPLRFRSPQPPDSWVHVRDATVPGPSCTQNGDMVGSVPPIGTEDCLYLNVFTPQVKPSKLLPVMFWIHGGGWMIGGATWVEAGFLLNHDVVLVTVNYRLGPLGFLSTEDEAAPGNFGLKDQVAALKWVKQNIEAFGGDPGSVTIFGNSAGAASVHYLMLTPLAKGLFHRAISESGSAIAPWAVPLPGAADKARRLAVELGCPEAPSQALVECLRGADEYDLTSKEPQFLEWTFNPLIPFRPVVEGDGEESFLTKHPSLLEPQTVVPWMTGVTSEDGCIQIAACVSNESLRKELMEDTARIFPITLLYHTASHTKPITEKILKFYFPSGDFPFNTLTEMYTDVLFRVNTDVSARRYRDKAPVYMYVFSYKGKYRTSKAYGAQDVDMGVCHADEMYYLFSNNSYAPISGEMPKRDLEMARIVTQLWTNFARTGNPTPNDEPLHWPKVSSGNQLEFVEIGAKLEVKKGFYEKSIEFWKTLPLEKIGIISGTKDEL